MAWAQLDHASRLARRVPTWVVYGLGAVPVLWLVWRVVSNDLGPDPAKVLERSLGEWGLRFLLASLAVTPLRRAGLNLLKFRRALGLLAFVYVALHLTVWIWPDMGLRWAQIWADIVKRPFILFGTTAFLCMVPLAATSSTAAIRRMGAPAWARLHRLAYAALVLALLHFVLLSRVWTIEVIVYAILGVALLAFRLPRLAGIAARWANPAGHRAR